MTARIGGRSGDAHSVFFFFGSRTVCGEVPVLDLVIIRVYESLLSRARVLCVSD